MTSPIEVVSELEPSREWAVCTCHGCGQTSRTLLTDAVTFGAVDAAFHQAHGVCIDSKKRQLRAVLGPAPLTAPAFLALCALEGICSDLPERTRLP